LMYKWLRLGICCKDMREDVSDPRLSILTEILNYCIFHIVVVYSDGDDYIYIYI
jgi:hypothetical protein